MGRRGLSYRWSEGRHHRHTAMNDIIQHALISAGVPARLKPPGLHHSDGKRPDGVSIVPGRAGKFLMWDATCKELGICSIAVQVSNGLY